MRLKQTFEVMELDDQIIAVPVGDGASQVHGLFKMNETAAFVFKLLQKGMTEQEIVDVMKKEYNAPEEKLSEDVHKCIETFIKMDLIEM